jgi:subtilase family serine protease
MFLRRFAFYCAVVLAPFALITGCSSSHAGLPVMPAMQNNSSGSSHTTAHWVRPKDLSGFPIDIIAQAVDVGAWGIDIQGYGVALNGSGSQACAAPGSTTASCHALYRSDITPNPASNPGLIPGFHPSDLQNMYNLTGASGGQNQTVAIIVAYQHDPESDINTYRTAFGIPPCTQYNGCLQVINLGSPCDFGDATCFQSQLNWGVEARLDAEMVSAVCPNCHIMIVDAPDNGLTNLGNAVQYAASHGATVISNSYSVPETSAMASYAGYWNTPGIPNIAGAGDQGYGPGFPASLSTVIAVGGTSVINQSGTWTSKVWAATGSGCSSFVSKPSYQTDTGCSMRTVNDVAALADPATGVAAFVSYIGGWTVFGGTSVSAPLVASMYALAGNGSSINNAASLYANASSFTQVLPEPNGVCSIVYLCDDVGVGPGYTGPSGVGTPSGLTGF